MKGLSEELETLSRGPRGARQQPRRPDDPSRSKRIKEFIEFASKKSSGDSEEAGRKKTELDREVASLQAEVGGVEDAIRKVTDDYISQRVRFEVLEYRTKVTESEIRELERSEREVRGELDAMKPDLDKAGERIVTQRAPYEVSEELKLVSAQLQKLQDLPDDAEKIYRDYTGNLEGLKGKLQELQDNKKLMLKELEERKKAWKNAVQNLIDEVAPIYQQVLSTVGATGAIRLDEGGSVAEAGLQLLVGFKGAEPSHPRPLHAERRREVGRPRRVHALAPEQDNLAAAGDGRVRHPHGPAQQGGDLQDDTRPGQEEPQLAAHRDHAVDNHRGGQDRPRHHRPVGPRLVSGEGVFKRRKIGSATRSSRTSSASSSSVATSSRSSVNPFEVDIREKLLVLKKHLPEWGVIDVMLKDSEAMQQLVAIVKLQDQWIKHRASALYIDPLLLELKIRLITKEELAESFAKCWHPIAQLDQLTPRGLEKAFVYWRELVPFSERFKDQFGNYGEPTGHDRARGARVAQHLHEGGVRDQAQRDHTRSWSRGATARRLTTGIS